MKIFDDDKEAIVLWTCPKCGKQLTREDQHHFCIKPVTIDEYISIQDEAVQQRLYQVRDTIRIAIPDAEERISWQMPTFWKGRNIIHFAVFKKHIGIYPGGEATEMFAEKLAGYDTSKGTIRLPHNKELPLELIAEIAQWAYKRNAK